MVVFFLLKEYNPNLTYYYVNIKMTHTYRYNVAQLGSVILLLDSSILSSR